METYYYCGMSYDSEEALAQAVENMRDKLENKPTEYVTVEVVTPTENGGWVMSGTYLSDYGINNLDENLHYSLSSRVTGDNYLGITKAEVEDKILELRKIWAKNINVNVVEATRIFSPTNVDMSVYING